MSIEKSLDMERRITMGWSMTSLMRWYYGQNQLQLYRTGMNTVATQADITISKYTVGFMWTIGQSVVSEEEGGTAQYGAKNADYLDPLDGTDDFIKAWPKRHPSLAAFSLGSVENGKIVRGAVSFPLLKTPRLYWAEDDGAFLQTEWYGPDDPCHVDADAKRGIVLASENKHPYKETLKAMGFDVLSLGGIVFKAACVADPQLLGQYIPKFANRGPVVGCVSSSAQAHDYVGVAPIVTGAGGFTGPLPLAAGKHGCVFANNEQNRDLMLEALHAR